MLYTPWLTTLDYLRRERRLTSTDPTRDDALLKQFIAEASIEFQEAVNHTCMPYVATRLLDYQGSYALAFGEDLLELTALTNGDGNAFTITNVFLEPANTYPKWRLVVKQSSATVLTYATDYRQAISAAGIYGYVPNYTSCWPSSGITVPVAGITDTATSLALTSGQGASFETGQYLKMGSEVMQITAIATDTLTLSRAELGTTAAAHLSGVVIYKFRVQPDIQAAVTEMARYYYLTKDQMGGRVQVFQNGVLQVQDIDQRVWKTVERHKRRQIVVIE